MKTSVVVTSSYFEPFLARSGKLSIAGWDCMRGLENSIDDDPDGAAAGLQDLSETTMEAMIHVTRNSR